MFSTVRKYTLILIIFFVFSSAFVHAKDSEEKDNIDKFSSWGVGKATKVELNDEHCGFLPEGCQAKMRGNWRKLNWGHGQFSADLNVEWQNSTPNGRRGFCAPMFGTAILELAGNDDKIFVSISGTACDLLFSSEKLPHQYTCTFAITGGTGEYENAKGVGDLKAIDYGKDKVFFSMKGEIAKS